MCIFNKNWKLQLLRLEPHKRKALVKAFREKLSLRPRKRHQLMTIYISQCTFQTKWSESKTKVFLIIKLCCQLLFSKRSLSPSKSIPFDRLSHNYENIQISMVWVIIIQMWMSLFLSKAIYIERTRYRTSELIWYPKKRVYVVALDRLYVFHTKRMLNSTWSSQKFYSFKELTS